MYGGFGSWSRGSSGLDASMQMRTRSYVDRRSTARGRGSRNRSNRAGPGNRGRGKGFRKSQQSSQLISSDSGHEEKFIDTAEADLDMGVGKLHNSGNSVQKLADSDGSAGNTGCISTPMPIKQEPNTTQTIVPQSKSHRAASSSIQETKLDPAEAEPCVEGNGHHADKPSDSNNVPKPAQNDQPSKKVRSKNVDAEEPKPTFVCKDCNVSCTSERSLKDHLIGKKHNFVQAEKKQTVAIMAATRKQSNQHLKNFGPPIKVGPLQKMTPVPGTSMQSVLRVLCEREDVVGMQYITEYRKLGTIHYRYMCELCDYICNMQEMVKHLVCRKHRMRYARIHLFSAYTKMTDYPSFKKMMLPTQLDNFLARLCARVVDADIARGMRPCGAKQYINESDIVIDVRRFSIMGKQHPSLLEDLLIAENILEEADFISQSTQTMGLIEPPWIRHRNVLTKLSEMDPAVARIKKMPIVPKSNLNQPGIVLEKTKRSVLQALADNSRRIKLYGVTGASAKERDGLLKRLKATNIKLQELHGMAQHSSQFDPLCQEADNSSTGATRMPNRRREHPIYEEIPPKRMKDGIDHSSSLTDSLSEIQKAVEPIIAETRRRVEQKIYEAIESGNLPSVLNALQNNPNLHDSLQKWQENQQVQEDTGHVKYDREHNDAGPSHRHPGHIEDPGYTDSSDAGQRHPKHADDRGYLEYTDAGPSQRRPGLIADRGYQDYSDARLLQRRPGHNEDPAYLEYGDELNVNGISGFQDDERHFSVQRGSRIPNIRRRRRGLLRRPRPGMGSPSLLNLRYDETGW